MSQIQILKNEETDSRWYCIVLTSTDSVDTLANRNDNETSSSNVQRFDENCSTRSCVHKVMGISYLRSARLLHG